MSGTTFGYLYLVGALLTFAASVAVLTYAFASDDYRMDGEDACMLGMIWFMASWAWPGVIFVGPAYVLAKRNNARKKASK